MPLWTGPGITRRELIGAAVAAGVARGQRSGAETRWALLADTHISHDKTNTYRGFRPYDNLRAVLPAVQKARPDGVVIDGDLARLEGLPGDYELFKETLLPVSSQTPVALSLGNHDHRKNFLATFTGPAPGRQSLADKYVLVLEHAPVRFVVLDSLLLPNQVPGLLGKAQRQWLERFLASSGNTPTVLFVHHTLDDSDGSLLDSDRFLRIATGAKNVKAVFYGHSHVYRYDVLDGVHLVNIPAVGYNFSDQEPVGWVEAKFGKDGADLTLRAIGGNTEQNGKMKSVSWRG